MLKYRNKWGIIKDMPIGELLNGRMRSTEEEGLFPCSVLPGSCPVCWVMAAARLHTHNK